MRENGAAVRSCPHCGNDTPVYQTEYNAAGTPLFFSVCVWCDGAIEYDGATDTPHEPYATVKDVQAQTPSK